MTTDNSRYEEAAKEYASEAPMFLNEHSQHNREGNHTAKMRHFLAGASFVRTDLEEKAEEFYSFGFKDGENKADLVINDLQDKLLERQKEYQLAIETAAILNEQRDEAIDKLEAAEKEAHNAAIDKVLETLNIRVEFGHLEAEWKRIKEELEKLKI